MRWAWWLAWRDARADRRRLLVYLSTIIAGVAALVAIRSFALNLENAVDGEAKVLLGADLEIYSRQPFTAAAETVIRELGGQQARQVQLASMAQFPAQGATRLVSVRAVEPGFPFYGEIETEPVAASRGFPRPQTALVDTTVMLQFGVRVGDVIRIGEAEFEIVGRVLRIPGEVPTATLVGPRVFIPLADLAATELIRPGSRARYSVFFRLPEDPEQVSARVEQLRPRLRAAALEAETVQYRRRLVGRGLENLGRFLYLAGFAALLLGGIGVASSMHLYARSKMGSVATLRCVGASPRAPVGAFLLQAVALGTIGAGVGAGLGVLAQRLLPWGLGEFLPVDVPVRWSTAAVLEGVATGVAVSVLFALLPLVGLRRVTPAAALRLFVAPKAAWRDPAVWWLTALCALGVFAISALGSGDAWLAAGLLAALTVVLGLLGLAALLTRGAVRRLLPRTWPFVLRQGLANLYRPRNQTIVVLLSLGFGVFVLGTVYLTQASLLQTVATFGLQSDANMVVFDIQPDQVAGVRGLLAAADMPVVQTTAVVPMRLAGLEGRPVAEIDDERRPAWLLRREYNSTYRESLVDSERVAAGEWIGHIEGFRVGDEARVPVSLEEDMAHDLELQIGSELAFNVQGMVVDTYVASTRTVDWDRVRPNFFVVFPAGVLESAPQQIVIVTRSRSPSQSAMVQGQLVSRFSNLSILDLASVFQTIEAVIERVDLAIRSVTVFCVLAGFGVLVVAVAGTRQQRTREAVLLRTLGASRRQIFAIGVSEYLLLGVVAAFCGSLLAIGGAWLLAAQVFDTTMAWGLEPLLGLGAAMAMATLLVGLWGNRGITVRSPLEVLRSRHVVSN